MYYIYSQRVSDEFFEQEIISVDSDSFSVYLADCDTAIDSFGGYLPIRGQRDGDTVCRLFAVTYERDEDSARTYECSEWELLCEWYHTSLEIRRLYDTGIDLPIIEEYIGQGC